VLLELTINDFAIIDGLRIETGPVLTVLTGDTGAGKTIMAGLILKELLFRGTVNKVLIVVPGGLTRQWVDEMAEKFGLNFRLINRVSFEAEPAQFARADDGLFVTSIDFIARDLDLRRSQVEEALKFAEAA